MNDGLPLGELRRQCFERDRLKCQWPKCDTHYPILEMAHLTHRGMGGAPSRNVLSNVVTLCRYHHGILDGREPWPVQERWMHELEAAARQAGVDVPEWFLQPEPKAGRARAAAGILADLLGLELSE